VAIPHENILFRAMEECRILLKEIFVEIMLDGCSEIRLHLRYDLLLLLSLYFTSSVPIQIIATSTTVCHVEKTGS
jgi:hypothetical protein